MKPLSEQTLYEILEVPPDATAADIETAYERARSLYSPGSLATYALMSAEEAALLTSRIEEAKTTLLDAGARARYDGTLGRVAEASAPQDGADGPPAAAAVAASGPPAGEPSAPAGAEPSNGVAPAETARPAILLREAARAAGAPAGGASRAPIRLDREVGVPSTPRAPEGPVLDVAEWTGDALRTAREARGITVQQIAERTKVTRHHIENIEGERFGALPAPVYLRGILLAIARELRLDGQKVARSYLERASASAASAGAPPLPPRR